MSTGRTTIHLMHNGKLKTLRFNNYAKEEVLNLYGHKQDIEKTNELLNAEFKAHHTRVVKKLVYAGLVGNYEALNKDIDFTMEDVSEWVADMPEDDMALVITSYMQCQAPKVIEEFQEEAKKKVERDDYVDPALVD